MSTIEFKYSDVSTVYNSIKSTAGTIKTDLDKMNSDYQAVVQVSGGAIYGALGEQLLLNWDNVSSSFPSFMNNFDSWGAVIAKSFGNYDAMEEQVKGFRAANPHGYSQTLTQRGMQAASGATPENLYSQSEFENRKAYGKSDVNEYKTYDDYLKSRGVVTRADALAEIKGNGTDPANQYAASSPINNSPVAGYDSANLPKYNSLETATGAEQTDGTSRTRSLVQSYTEAEDFERTATVVAEGSDEAVNGGDAGDPKAQASSTPATDAAAGKEEAAPAAREMKEEEYGDPQKPADGQPGVPEKPQEPTPPPGAQPGDPKPEEPQKPDRPPIPEGEENPDANLG